MHGTKPSNPKGPTREDMMEEQEIYLDSPFLFL